jgi:hypothetical protein
MAGCRSNLGALNSVSLYRQDLSGLARGWGPLVCGQPRSPGRGLSPVRLGGGADLAAR